jgi:uncharacterized membrane protein YGL010W
MPRLLLSPGLRALVSPYAESHRTAGNQLLHVVGIPLIAVSTLGLLSKIPLPRTGASARMRCGP